jgi:phage terminase large subunit
MFQQKSAAREIETTEIYRKNRLARERYVVNSGGARSTKSWSIAQLFIDKFVNERGKKFLVTRKTFPALRLTSYKLVVDLLKDYGLYSFCKHNKTEHTIELYGNYMLFASIDDPEKIKSTEWNYVWMEEANEFNYEDFIIMKTRMSGPTDRRHPNQIYFSWNPVDEFSWVNQKVMLNQIYARKKQIRIIHSTYKDNPFLDQDYIDDLESLEQENPNYWRIYGLGEMGKLENVIYNPYIITEEYPENFDQVIYGLDFGFNNESALLKIGEYDAEFYLEELLYEKKLTNTDLIARLETLIPEEHRDCETYADAAEPARIAEIFAAGFNILPADKSKDSVKRGIDFCKSVKFHTKASNVNLNKERSSYCYKVDKNGHIGDDPVKFHDHLMDGKRYPMYTHYKTRKEPRAIVI